MFKRIGVAAAAIVAGALGLVYVNMHTPAETPQVVPEARADTHREPDYGWRPRSAEFRENETPVVEYY